MTPEGLLPIVAAHEHELIALRRLLHAQPEASGREHLTTEVIRERLAVEGLQPVLLQRGTGLVCDISLDPERNPALGSVRTVVLRADIDALSMDDGVTAPYRSQHPGLAHACGHDVHATALLGAGLALLEQSRTEPRAGVVRLVFEPAEEQVPGGAVDVIAEGWLRDVESVFGLHCDPKIDVGTVGILEGALTSAADQFEISLTGPGGHTARPELTVDLVRWMGRLCDRLGATVHEATDGSALLVFGAALAGDAPNVIPATARLRGSLRSPERATWESAERLVRTAIEKVLGAGDAGSPPDWSLRYLRGMPPVINHPATTALVREAVAGLLGSAAVVPTQRSMGGDSFAWYADIVPGTYIRLGTHDPASPHGPRDLHSADFDVDERAIGIGAAVLAACAVRALAPAT